MMKPGRFPPASVRYGVRPPAQEPKATAPAGATVPAEDAEFDEDGRRILTAPLAAPFRAVPTVMPPPASRSLPRPVRSQSTAEMAAARAKAGGVFPKPVLPRKAPPQPARKLTFTADDVPFTLR